MSIVTTGAGDVEITLDGQVMHLRPSLKAAMTLTNMQGGVPHMTQRCLNYELDAVILVVSVGIGIQSKDLAEKVWSTGVIDLAAPCIRYLHVLSNGGRPVSDEEAKEEEAPLVQTDSQ